MATLSFMDAATEEYNQIRAAAIQAQQTRLATGKTKSSKQEGLFKQVRKTLALLKSNPKHTGLNTHEYDSLPNPLKKGEKVFEAYVQNNTPGAYRVFWCYGPGRDVITIIAITPHP